jgi:hypothetical protein
MKNVTDNDLTLLYYGEHDDPGLAATVAESGELSARYDALCAELALADSYAPPLRDEGYGVTVWQRIEPQITDRQRTATAPRRGWLASLMQPRFSFAGALSFVLVATLAFILGRVGTQDGNTTVDPSGGATVAQVDIDTNRLLTHTVSDHLDQVNLVLTQFVNANGAGAAEIEYATDMLVANRLYRQAAAAQGKQKLAAFLADLEPLLIELAYGAQSASPETRKRMQQEVRNGLLFRVRVMNGQLNKPEISV